jgi:hypothetical protein
MGIDRPSPLTRRAEIGFDKTLLESVTKSIRTYIRIRNEKRARRLLTGVDQANRLIFVNRSFAICSPSCLFLDTLGHRRLFVPDSLLDLESRRAAVQLQIAQLGDMRLAPLPEQVVVATGPVILATAPTSD